MDGKTSLLFGAIKDGDDNLVDLLLYASIHAIVNKKGDVRDRKTTPLHYALNYSNPKIIFSLINHDADVNALQTDYGCQNRKSQSCFQKAIQLLPKFECDPKELLTAFLAHGANPNEQSNNTSGGMSSDYYTQYNPIHTLTRHNTLDIGCLRLLLQYKANVNAPYKYYGSDEFSQKNTLKAPLHIAVHNKNLAMVQLLIEWQADINMKSRKLDRIMEELKSNSVPIKSVLVERTPLHIAIQENSKEIVRYLVINGANPFIDYKESSSGVIVKILTTWELTQNEELKQLLTDIQITPKDYKILHKNHKMILKILLLCNLRNNWKLPKDILFKIFSYFIQRAEHVG